MFLFCIFTIDWHVTILLGLSESDYLLYAVKRASDTVADRYVRQYPVLQLTFLERGYVDGQQGKLVKSAS
jgi:hypothetical protein